MINAGCSDAEVVVGAIADAEADAGPMADADDCVTRRLEGGSARGEESAGRRREFESIGCRGERKRSNGPLASLGSLAIDLEGIAGMSELKTRT